MPLGIMSSLNDPVIVPSRLAPLSLQIQITSVPSSVPSRLSKQAMRLYRARRAAPRGS